MRPIAHARRCTVCCIVVLLGCAGEHAQRATRESAAAAPAATPTGTAGIAPADLEGKWTMRVTTERGDSTPGYVLDAAGEPARWTVVLPNRPPMSARAALGGDSLTIDFGPYESVLRKGVQVRTHTVARLRGGNLVGTMTARYATAGSDTVRHFRVEGARTP